MNSETVEIAVAVRLLAAEAKEKSLRIASAESCTGGGIGRLLSSIAESSRWYIGGVIAYSDDVKQNLLNVCGDDLQKFGAVSEPVVKQMVTGVLAITDADIGVAVSGIAGPGGGSADKPVGTVWLAWGITKQPVNAKVYNFAGNREAVRRQTEDKAIIGLLELIRHYTGNGYR